MNPGGHTVTFIGSAITAGRLGATTAPTDGVAVPGCFMQPLAVSEVVTDTDVETESWRCIAPPVTAAVDIDTNGTLLFQGDVYQVTGSKPFSDFSGRIDHVTIDCKRQFD